VAFHVIWALSQAALVFGAAIAGSAKATVRVKARIDTRAFIGRILRFRDAKDTAAPTVKRCYRLSLSEWFVAAGLGFCNPRAERAPESQNKTLRLFLALGRFSMKHKRSGPVEAFLPGIVWRASQCGWLRVGKTAEGHDVWEKPNGQMMNIRCGIEPLVPGRTRTGTLLRRRDLEGRPLSETPVLHLFAG
jgi:hypothetical protein